MAKAPRPVTPVTPPDVDSIEGTSNPALAVMLNTRLFERCKEVAEYLAAAKGFVPPHLHGQTEACFAVVLRSLTWRLDPYAVAQATYQTPAGRVGYEGKLCQAALEASGHLVGPVMYEHYGDWSKVHGKYEIRKNDKGRPFAVRTWDVADADGLGVTVRAQVRGEQQPRELDFDLVQAFPLNSTLWATDPKTQICYTAVRRFASRAAPGLFMGVQFDDEASGPEAARDITPPRPDLRSYEDEAEDLDQRYAETVGEPEPEPEAEQMTLDDADAMPPPQAQNLRTDAPKEVCDRWGRAYESAIRSAQSQEWLAEFVDVNKTFFERFARGQDERATELEALRRERWRELEPGQ